MGFIDSYKNLEKLCGEMYDEERRLSAYIDDMKKVSNGSFYVKGWDDDLKQLKYYRWIRNKISHEPNCNEQNMCDPSDTEWLDNFRARIMSRTDPLALYSQTIKKRTATRTQQATRQGTETKSTQVISPKPTNNEYSQQKFEDDSSKDFSKVWLFVVCAIAVVCLIIFIVKDM